MDRIWISVNKTTNNSPIKIMQWNTLANSLCDQNAFPHADRKALEWSHRVALMQKEIQTIEPDILCMQEVDETCYTQFLSNDYRGVFGKKFGISQDGCVILARRRVILHDYECVRLGPTDSQVAIWMEVEFDNQKFVVICVHLKAKPENELVRVRQCEVLLKIIHWRPLPVVMCGDFNDVVGSKPIELVRKQLASVYDMYHPKPFNTTSKKRDTVVTRAIDYVWVSSTIQIMNVLELPVLELMPSLRYPSDHMSLCVSVSIQKTTQTPTPETLFVDDWFTFPSYNWDHITTKAFIIIEDPRVGKVRIQYEKQSGKILQIECNHLYVKK